MTKSSARRPTVAIAADPFELPSSTGAGTGRPSASEAGSGPVIPTAPPRSTPQATWPDLRPEIRDEQLWSQLQALIAVARLSSFTRAAQRLSLSKAAVSQRISDLERHLGQQLVQRTTRSVRLSEAGQRLVEQAEPGLVLLSRSLTEARDAAGAPRGLLRVTAPVALGRQHVAPMLVPFFERYPDLRIELDLSDRLVPLTQEGFDLAIRHTSQPPDTHVAFKLCESRALLLASPSYLARAGRPQHPAELAQHRCLPYLRPGPAHWFFERRAGVPAERLRVPVQGLLRAGNSEVLRDAALAGLGLALLPDFSARDAVRDGQLIEVLPDWRVVGFFGEAIYAVHPWSSHTPQGVRLLIEHLKAAMNGGF
ncbi:LysR family transcriptional regulator [Roseateles amylovorans]|uniref:LysR family transcriptional regulator n=1 Tax=Roseateles amylovorans TaxID=2978473 RepID=A0ABY6B3R7_9BURK|nr:LysR family transcriptional regulator [Roseateles amylovorans]UXH78619.1 LysR family transcriptional regulator [Roseateles amylovorans]